MTDLGRSVDPAKLTPWRCALGLHRFDKYVPPTNRRYTAKGLPLLQKYRVVCSRCGTERGR